VHNSYQTPLTISYPQVGRTTHNKPAPLVPKIIPFNHKLNAFNPYPSVPYYYY